METLGTLTTILLIVFSILNVILFIKFWVMTDNVKRILDIMENKSFTNAEISEKQESNVEQEMDEEEISDRKRNNILLTIVIVFVALVILLAAI